MILLWIQYVIITISEMTWKHKDHTKKKCSGNVNVDDENNDDNDDDDDYDNDNNKLLFVFVLLTVS